MKIIISDNVEFSEDKIIEMNSLGELVEYCSKIKNDIALEVNKGIIKLIIHNAYSQ